MSSGVLEDGTEGRYEIDRGHECEYRQADRCL
jgi:hypothetical protein